MDLDYSLTDIPGEATDYLADVSSNPETYDTINQTVNEAADASGPGAGVAAAITAVIGSAALGYFRTRGSEDETVEDEKLDGKELDP